MKAYVVCYELDDGTTATTLLLMRKGYRRPTIVVRRWTDAEGLDIIIDAPTENYFAAAGYYLGGMVEGFSRIVSMGEVWMR